ncbi:MAG: Gfo/Idh/MocA family oxidoreductase [Candidatus Sumerlaeota bacterium]|nr:Gfo/Idh/MocA family oxidoreductase [Candidatus Sumerlaeota bacterium]
MATIETNNSMLKKGVMAAGAVAATAAVARMAYGAGSDTIKIGLLGCGGRGSGAIVDCLDADPGLEVVAYADLFKDKAVGLCDRMKKDAKWKDKIKATPETCFGGFDCHEQIAKSNADLLLMATAPGFRGRQLMAAIKAGKHVFTEKPVATDVAGCREVMAASKLAEEKKLHIVCGTQRRHEFSRVELMKRIHDGEIGELIGGQCYWIGGGIWYHGDVKPGMSEMEWQCYNWYHFTWLSGDQICEQHIHNIDVMNWCFNGPPAKFTAVGGRGCRDTLKADGNITVEEAAKKACKSFNGTEQGFEKYKGDIWDHVYAEFEYPNGARCLSFSGHGPGTGAGDEKIVGTKGTSNCNNSYSGEKSWKFAGKNVVPMKQEHIDLIQSIRQGKYLNEGQRIAESTLTAIGARIAANTGKTISWDWLMKACKQDLVPRQIGPGKGLFHPISTGHDPLV